MGYQPGTTVVDTVRALVRKTVAWPYELAKAYMGGVPENVRHALALAVRSQPETGEAVRRYAQAALAGRAVDPYRTLGLLTTEESAAIADMTGVGAIRREMYDWAVGQYAPLHIHKEHGDAATESARGQRAVTAEDYARIPGVIASADRTWAEDGRVIMEKEIGVGQERERFVLVWQPQKSAA